MRIINLFSAAVPFLLSGIFFSDVCGESSAQDNDFSANIRQAAYSSKSDTINSPDNNVAVMRLQFGPNPFRPKTGENITIELSPENSSTPYMLSGRVMFVDCLGNVINKATFKNASGKITMKWDGKDDSGKFVNPGTYTLKMNVENEKSGRIRLEKPLSMLIGVRE